MGRGRPGLLWAPGQMDSIASKAVGSMGNRELIPAGRSQTGVISVGLMSCRTKSQEVISRRMGNHFFRHFDPVGLLNRRGSDPNQSGETVVLDLHVAAEIHGAGVRDVRFSSHLKTLGKLADVPFPTSASLCWCEY